MKKGKMCRYVIITNVYFLFLFIWIFVTNFRKSVAIQKKCIYFQIIEEKIIADKICRPGNVRPVLTPSCAIGTTCVLFLICPLFLLRINVFLHAVNFELYFISFFIKKLTCIFHVKLAIRMLIISWCFASSHCYTRIKRDSPFSRQTRLLLWILRVISMLDAILK